MSASHPAVRFQNIPIIAGPLTRFQKVRSQIINDVVASTEADMLKTSGSLDVLLGEALYAERLRLKRARPNVFTKTRLNNDQALWNQVQSGLVKPSAEVDRKVLLEMVTRHYTKEICGNFDANVYRFATLAVPWGFNWLLNAASVKRFLPWGMTESLASSLQVVGEVPALQRLAKKGTILLVPTHQSNIDSVLIGYLIYLMGLPPFAYGAGLNLFSNPLLSFFMNRLGAYTVDREKTNAIYKRAVKNYSTRILREGIHSIFFPGGGRSRSGAIENKVKLGLLGTGLEAQIQGYQMGSTSPRVYVVPMVTSYHFVLEASSLIENFLADSGKHKFIASHEYSWQPGKELSFFWKLFSAQSSVTVRIGKALDIFGNFVDEDGESIGPNGTMIDPQKWLTTQGELKADPQRDDEYTRELGERLTDRFHKENTVLTSHLVAFAFFETLRKNYVDYDVFRFMRLSLPQRSMSYADFLASAEAYHKKILNLANRGKLFLSDQLRTADTEVWVKDGVRQLGHLHDAAVVKIEDGAVWTEDMQLLYYYRNRLAGYGLSLLADRDDAQIALRKNDSQGFLA